jgi:hypothetical protein
LRRRARLVLDLYQKLPPPLLDQLRFGRPGRDLHPHLRVNVDREQTVSIQHPLQLSRIPFLDRRLQFLLVRRLERDAEIIRRFDQPLHLGGERLRFDIGDNT